MQQIGRPWGEAEDSKLTQLWAEGLTGEQIGQVLGRSRSAVLGRIHRKGLPLRKEIGATAAQKMHRIRARRRTALRQPLKAKPNAKPPTLPPEEPEDLKPLFSVSLMQLNEFTCRYPIGDPQEPGFTFCGRTCSDTYCTGHRKLCFTPVNKRQSRATERLANWLDRRSFKVAA